MRTSTSTENPYGASFSIHAYARAQVCPKCGALLEDEGHVVSVCANEEMVFLCREESRVCCGREYYTFISFREEFQARIAIETYESMLRVAFAYGIALATVVPIGVKSFHRTEDTSLQ